MDARPLAGPGNGFFIDDFDPLWQLGRVLFIVSAPGMATPDNQGAQWYE
jgi:hypothetical protein